jgi:hypothetical protein
MPDLDYLKTINDSFGHQMDDRVPVKLAEKILANTRKSGALVMVKFFSGTDFQRPSLSPIWPPIIGPSGEPAMAPCASRNAISTLGAKPMLNTIIAMPRLARSSIGLRPNLSAAWPQIGMNAYPPPVPFSARRFPPGA